MKTPFTAPFFVAFALLLSLGSPVPVLAGPTPSQGVRPGADQKNPLDAGLQYQQGLQALVDKDSDAAQRAFLAALRADNQHVPAMLGMAELAFRRNQQSEIARWLKQAERTAPNDADVHASWGRYWLMRGQGPAGEAALLKAMQLDPKSIRPRMDLADARLSRGEAKSALPLYREVLALNPAHAGAHYALGLALLQLGELAQGQAALKRSAELEPKNPLPLLALARSQTDAAAAMRGVDQVLALQPNFYDALMLRAQLQVQANDGASARKTWELAAQAAPKAAEPLVRLGMAAESEGNFDEARANYLRALERDSSQPFALNNLANLSVDSDAARAETMAKRAVRAMPQMAAFHDTLASASRARKDKAGALAAAKEAVRLAPQNGDFVLRLADTQLWVGDRVGAKRTLDALVTAQPRYPDMAKVQALLAKLK